jgi:predicted RNA binding protein YcfA (HicA-like mRNA interferase family)
MSKLEKIIEEFLGKPTEASFRDVSKVLEACGYEERHSGSGSHRVFTKPGHFPIIVPTIKGRHVKGTYIQMIVERLGLEEWYD